MRGPGRPPLAVRDYSCVRKRSPWGTMARSISAKTPWAASARSAVRIAPARMRGACCAQSDTLQDGIAQAAGSHQRGDGRGAHGDDGAGADAAQDGRRREGELDAKEPGKAGQAQGFRRFGQGRGDGGEARASALHDGEQAVEEQRDRRGDDADAQRRDEQREERERGDGLKHPRRAEDQRGEASPARGQDAQRNAAEDARRQRRGHQLEVAKEGGGDDARHRRAHPVEGRCVRPEGIPQQGRGRVARAASSPGHGVVAARHGAAIDVAHQAKHGGEGRGRAGLEVQAIDDDGLIAREKAPVVVEDAQGEAIDLRIGGVGVDDVGASGRESLEGEVVLDAAHVCEGDAVAAAEPRPPVGPPEELVAEGAGQARAVGGLRQVGERAQRLALRDAAGDGERVGVLEPKRTR